MIIRTFTNVGFSLNEISSFNPANYDMMNFDSIISKLLKKNTSKWCLYRLFSVVMSSLSIYFLFILTSGAKMNIKMNFQAKFTHLSIFKNDFAWNIFNILLSAYCELCKNSCQSKQKEKSINFNWMPIGNALEIINFHFLFYRNNQKAIKIKFILAISVHL